MLIVAALFLLLCGSVHGSSSVKVTVVNCTKSTDAGSIYSIVTNPASPEKTDANWTVTAQAVVDVDIKSGTFEAVAKLGPIPIFKQGGDLCEAAVIKLPDDYGTIYYNGVNCPIANGSPLVLSMTAVVSSSAPDDTVKISVTTKDTATDNEIICVDVVASVEAKDQSNHHDDRH